MAPPRTSLPTGTATLLSAPSGTGLVRLGKAVKPRAGLRLQMGDLLTAGKNGGVNARLGDLGSLRLRAGSALRFKEVLRRVPKEPQRVSNRLRLEKGTLLVKLRPLLGQSRFVVETPGAVTAARGTSFLVQASGKRTLLLVRDGLVAVSLPSVPGTEVEVGANQKLMVAAKLPPKPEPVETEDEKRLRELDELARAIERETEPLIAQIDAALASRRYADAEAAAQYVTRRAWGLRTGVRAHARLHEVGLRRDNVLAIATPVPTLSEHLLALAGVPRRLTPVSAADARAAEDAVGPLVQRDAVVRRFSPVAILGLRVWGGAASLAEGARLHEEAAARSPDPPIAAILRATGSLLRWSHAATLEGIDRSQALRLFRDAYDRMPGVIADPNATADIRVQAYLILAHRHGRLPEAARDHAPRLRYAREMLQLARATRWARHYTHVALAHAALGEAEQAVKLFPASCEEMRRMGLGPNLVLVAGIAQAYGDRGDTAREQYWRGQLRTLPIQ